MEIDCLNLEWVSYPSRDRIMATLVSNYIRYMGYSVLEKSIFNGYYYLTITNPKVFFITNVGGADINFKLVKYAKLLGLKCASLISEGIFTEDDKHLEEFIWGWNTDKTLYEDIHMQWSERTRDITIMKYPILKGKVKVSGGVGFDCYKINVSEDKKTFLKKYRKDNYEKIIGVGCWDFGVLYSKDHRFSTFSKIYNEKEIARLKYDQKSFNRVLKNIVKDNPHILFLLKEHPGRIGDISDSAIDGLVNFQNTLILKNEENIKDCITVCDFWMVYESTTAMEAWLLNKQTCLLNPSGTDFKRANVYKGSPNYSDEQSLQSAIDMFYSNGYLPGFNELYNERKRIIKENIQWDDGLNHVRAGNEIIDLIINEGIPKKQNHFNNFLKKDIIKQIILWNLSPYLCSFKKFETYAERRRAFNQRQLKEFQTKCMKEQITFYEKNGLIKEDLRIIRCI